MSIRDILKQRSEARDKAASGESEFPEGVTRYVKLGRHGEINKDGRTLVLLGSPDDWFIYFVHEDKTYNGRGYDHNFRKHTCSHSPKGVVQASELANYLRAGKDECLSCKAGAKRKMFFMIPVYDPQYKTYRVIDIAEFHADNLIADYDKIEKTMQKATKNPEYSIVGEAAFFKQVDKSYSLESGDVEDEVIEAAKAFIGADFGFEELANFREKDDIVKLLNEAEGGIDKSVLPKVEQTAADEELPAEENFEF